MWDKALAVEFVIFFHMFNFRSTGMNFDRNNLEITMNYNKVRLLNDDRREYVFSFPGIIPKRIPKTTIQANGYFERGEFIGKSLDVQRRLEKTHVCGFTQTFVNDGVDSTCVDTIADGKQLQVIFYFSFVSPCHKMSVEVVMKNLDNCTSPAWTWFVGSGCLYNECFSKQLHQTAEFTRCAVTCVCFESCNYLYFMYNQIPWKSHKVEQLCEIRAI